MSLNPAPRTTASWFGRPVIKLAEKSYLHIGVDVHLDACPQDGDGTPCKWCHDRLAHAAHSMTITIQGRTLVLNGSWIMDPVKGTVEFAHATLDPNLATHLGDGPSWEGVLNGGAGLDLSKFITTPEVAATLITHHEREGAIGRLVAWHENNFARLAMDQAQLLLDELPDRVTMEALNRMMARHAAILAELRR